MLESARKTVALARPLVPWKALASITSIVSFVWLLAQDQIHPFVIYLLQAYLAF